MEKSNKRSEKVYAEITSCEIRRAREWKKGAVFFDCTLNGIEINGCKVVAGHNGDFISWPSYKGSDGNWYNTVYVSLDDDTQKEILRKVQDKLDA